MARTKTTTIPEQADVRIDHAAVAAGSQALTVLGTRSAEVSALFDNDLPYERNRIVSEARFFMSQSAEAMLEAGKRLIVLKENEAHGDFMSIITGQLGMADRTARLIMQAAVKFTSPALESNRQSLADLGKTKLFDLMAESDEDLVELGQGGTIAGLHLDDMQSMTSRELRAALVEARKAAASKDRLIAKKDQTINEQSEQLERRMAVGDALRLEVLRTDTLAAEQAIARLVATASEIFDTDAEGSLTFAARQAIDWVAMRFTSSATERGIHIEELADSAAPAFLGPVSDIANGRTPN